jgi:hypothetical protein
LTAVAGTAVLGVQFAILYAIHDSCGELGSSARFSSLLSAALHCFLGDRNVVDFRCWILEAYGR